ncbi:MAG TPA: Crp/Fnr family transcriptional regulator [Candidatus Kapabacteria bacterium]|nr:Crp/Fnr family transcriptional regulator [Candidatus Kapabacteria bacterium]
MQDLFFNNKEYSELFKEIQVKPKTILLKEGEISNYLYFIKEGCLRLWFNNDGKEITFQFFFENQAFSGLFGKRLGFFNLESIETSTLLIMKNSDLLHIIKEKPKIKEDLFEILLQRLEDYCMLFLSRIKDNPKKRYIDLLENQPEIIKRIPQQYIASYLGITPISLSRIKKKIHFS